MTLHIWNPLDQLDAEPLNANFAAVETDIAAAQTTASAAIPSTQKGAANGVASLGSDGILTLAQRPPATGGGGITYTPPLAASFTSFINQGSSTKSDGTKSLKLIFDSHAVSGGNQLKAILMSAPATPYTIDMIIQQDFPHMTFQGIGPIFGSTSSSSYDTFMSLNASGDYTIYKPQLMRLSWSDANTVASTAFASMFANIGAPLRWRITDDGTTRNVYVSNSLDPADVDGLVNVMSVSRTDSIANPNMIGIGFLASLYGTIAPILTHCRILHWHQS